MQIAKSKLDPLFGNQAGESETVTFRFGHEKRGGAIDIREEEMGGKFGCAMKLSVTGPGATGSARCD